MYEVFEHTADLGLRVRSATFERLCEDAARGLTEIIAGDTAQIRPVRAEAFDVRAEAPEYLLFDLLNELLYAFESRRMLFAEFEATRLADGVRLAARGEVYDPSRHSLAHEVKAITYHSLEVKQTAEGWQATVIVDI